MSQEQFMAFLKHCETDASLQQKVESATDSDSVIAIAKDAGFAFSLDDIKNAQSQISDADLDGVAGGFPPTGGIKGGIRIPGL
jgi:predicted ribosomally synthesized peptide with nif11-like leader